MSASIAYGPAEHAAADRDRPVALSRRLASRRISDRLFAQAIVGLTLPVFLVVVATARLLPAGRRDAGRRGRSSVFREAVGAARTCGSLALMG